MEDPSSFAGCREGDQEWYDLFSRGARDWLRHNDKVRRAVREQLPEILAHLDVHSTDGARIVKVPVRLLEHFRFRLRETGEGEGVGQGKLKPGDKISQSPSDDSSHTASGGNEEGGLQLLLEFKVDEIVEWMWSELKLPNLEPKSGSLTEDEYVRQGWNRHGVRSRLDRRRSLKESIKRRAVNRDGPAFVDNDLRFRQLVLRPRPSTEAVVFLALDVSSSMRDQDRQLAKTFFFWAIQGLRRQYNRIQIVFLAHTVKAWEFQESEFFQVQGSGGTVASTVFGLAQEILAQRYDAARYNSYVFYASDGENFKDDRQSAQASLARLAKTTSFIGYVETPASDDRALHSETASIFAQLAAETPSVASYALTDPESVWSAIRAFFQQQVDASKSQD